MTSFSTSHNLRGKNNNRLISNPPLAIRFSKSKLLNF